MSVKAMVDILVGNAAVTTLVEDRVTPEWRDQGTKLPAITVTTISANRGDHLTSARSLTEGLVQVDCYAETYADVQALASAVRAAADQFGGTAGGVDVDRISTNSFRDLGEKDGDRDVRRVSIDFNVWYQE